MMLRGPPLDIQGGGEAGVFVAGKFFISTGLGGALKISLFITCLYRTVLGSKLFIYLFQSPPEIIYLKKNPAPPSPWKLNGAPLRDVYYFSPLRQHRTVLCRFKAPRYTDI